MVMKARRPPALRAARLNLVERRRAGSASSEPTRVATPVSALLRRAYDGITQQPGVSIAIIQKCCFRDTRLRFQSRAPATMSIVYAATQA